MSLCYKCINIYSDQIARENIDRDMTFLGFILFTNEIKDDSIKMIKELNACKIKTIIAIPTITLISKIGLPFFSKDFLGDTVYSGGI